MSGGEHGHAGEATWRVERYDATWGGWRAVPKTWTNDDPATFRTKRAASDACRDLQSRSSYPYRVREVSS